MKLPAGRLVIFAQMALGICPLFSSEALAETDLGSRARFSGFFDLRSASVDGNTSWLDGGFGKTRFSSNKAPFLADATLVWQPRLSSVFDAVTVIEHQKDQRPQLDISEAYLRYRTSGANGLRIRAGLFFPPISLEHDGLQWGVTNTITPSAISSWIAEEVKVVGVEGTSRISVKKGELSATAAVFGANDTAGALLAYRGWALHDLKSTASGSFAVAPLSGMFTGTQRPFTSPIDEVDHRLGVYAKVEWRPHPGAAFSVFGYDNGGSRSGFRNGQYAWGTRFASLAVNLTIDEKTQILTQAIYGETLMGKVTPLGTPINMDFASAYLLVSRDVGPGNASARVDYFRTDDNTFVREDNNNEDGWALTGAYHFDLMPGASLIFEALHVESDRPARTRIDLQPTQTESVLQSSLRMSF